MVKNFVFYCQHVCLPITKASVWEKGTFFNSVCKNILLLTDAITRGIPMVQETINYNVNIQFNYREHFIEGKAWVGGSASENGEKIQKKTRKFSTIVIF